MIAIDYAGRIRNYENIKKQINALSGSIDICLSNLTTAQEKSEKIIISGQSIDEGKIAEVKTSINKLPSILSSIISECNEKISYCEDQLRKINYWRPEVGQSSNKKPIPIQLLKE